MLDAHIIYDGYDHNDDDYYVADFDKRSFAEDEIADRLFSLKHPLMKQRLANKTLDCYRYLSNCKSSQQTETASVNSGHFLCGSFKVLE